VKFAAEPETVIAPPAGMDDDRVKQLEEALETAARERQEILEAAEKEIEYHRSIAAELETSMINDFEWKLHEIESEYKRKLREGNAAAAAAATSSEPQPSTSSYSSRRRSPLKSHATAHAGEFDHDLFDLKVQQAKNEIVRQKDDELAKMHIQVIHGVSIVLKFLLII
jgi:electron transfer flavoprotein alpha subunit